MLSSSTYLVLPSSRIACARVKIDKELLRKHLPSWADDLVAKNALDVSEVNPDALQKMRLKNCDFSLFEPERYVDLDPRVGVDETARALKNE